MKLLYIAFYWLSRECGFACFALLHSLIDTRLAKVRDSPNLSVSDSTSIIFMMCINSYAAYFIDQSHILRSIDIDVPFLVWFFLSFTTWFLWISLFSWVLELWKISYFHSIMHGKALYYILWFASSHVRTDHPTFCKPCRLVS